MVNTLSGKLLVENEKFCIIISRFNEFITSKLLSGAIDELVRHRQNQAFTGPGIGTISAGCAESNCKPHQFPHRRSLLSKNDGRRRGGSAQILLKTLQQQNP